jgi:protease IV
MSSNIASNKNWFTDLLKACWGVINFTRKAILNILFLIIAFLIIAAMSNSNEQPITFSENSILELKLVGTIVEEKTNVDPYAEILRDAMGSNDDNPEVLLTDILNALDHAANDPKITMLKLNLHGLRSSGLSKLQEVGYAIARFKEKSKKPVVVYGDYFSQTQYYLASYADTVIIHPMGSVLLEGFGRYRSYYKSGLEKLKISSHIFRVGTFKSAVEPYIRDDMSPAAKEANTKWLGNMWEMYKADVAQQRDMTEKHFDEKLDGLVAKFESVNGDFAELALTNKMVDMVMTHQEFDDYLKEQQATSKLKYVSLNKYLSYVEQKSPILTNDKVGIVVARGTIYDGTAKPGNIGGHSTAKLLRRARLDDSIKAVVLRIDSPGGSAFASEIIRNEIDALKAAGKPVIASMSSVAASGGYWIAASADEIWASPTTITGSIGIFGMFMTFENTFAELGIYEDGVGTTELAGINVARSLPKGVGELIQLSVENGYRQFLNLVATERSMTVEAVDAIAQGRIWSGKTAHGLGLVDQLGLYDDAIAAAAEKAELTDYSITTIKAPVKGFDKMIQELLGVAHATFGESEIISNAVNVKTSPLAKAFNGLINDASEWIKFNDPKHTYIYCMDCVTID